MAGFYLDAIYISKLPIRICGESAGSNAIPGESSGTFACINIFRAYTTVECACIHDMFAVFNELSADISDISVGFDALPASVNDLYAGSNSTPAGFSVQVVGLNAEFVGTNGFPAVSNGTIAETNGVCVGTDRVCADPYNVYASKDFELISMFLKQKWINPTPSQAQAWKRNILLRIVSQAGAWETVQKDF